MLHGPFSISLIGWVVSKGFFVFFFPFGLDALYTSCILSGVLQAFFIQLLLLIKKKKVSGNCIHVEYKYENKNVVDI